MTLDQKNEKKNENRCGRLNMALHLNKDKDQNVVSGSSFLSNPVFEIRRGEKGEKRLGLGKDQVLGGVSSHFLFLCDQTT